MKVDFNGLEKVNKMYYRKKPIVIEAIQWDGSHKSTKEVIEFRGQKVSDDTMTQHKFDEYVQHCNDNGMFIDTLEGQIIASVGDWIIKGVQGEFYPCKPDIFEKTYESLEEEFKRELHEAFTS